VAPAGDDPVAHRERLPVRFNFHRKFGHYRAISCPDPFGKSSILGRIELRQTGADYCDRASFCCERTLVGRGINPRASPLIMVNPA